MCPAMPTARRSSSILGQDIGESNDLAAADPERVQRMVAALEAWKEEVDAH